MTERREFQSKKTERMGANSKPVRAVWIGGAAALGLLLCCIPSATAQFAPEPAPPPTPADLVLSNGRIYTPSGWVESVAVDNGVIVALGDAAAVRPYVGEATAVRDLQGATVLPGLHDMHVHPTGAGLAERQCQLPHGSTRRQILAIVRTCASARQPGQWITGRAWEATAFGQTPPHKSMLDEVAPNNPAVFTDISGHSTWVNSAALRLAGITRDTPNPSNGIIERDALGEPTGILREQASGLVYRLIPPPTREENMNALRWALGQMLAQGITAFDDAGVSASIAQAYADLADRGELHQRVRGCLFFRDENLIARRGVYARERFSPSCVKMIVDGVPTDSHTAAMLEDYQALSGEHGGGRERGMLMLTQDDMNSLITRFDRMGLTVKVHAAGDAAVRSVLDGIAAARQANGFSGLLHNPGHNSFVHMSDIRRARALGAAFEFSPYIWYESPIIGDIRKAIGPERMERWIPIRDALEAGVLSVPGSDWAVVPTVNPWIAIEALVTRQQPGGRGAPLGAQERISLEQAIDMYTINSARQRYQADRTGTIERGKLADFVVIDQNIFEVPVATIHRTHVLMTIINGEVVYEAPRDAARR